MTGDARTTVIALFCGLAALGPGMVGAGCHGGGPTLEAAGSAPPPEEDAAAAAVDSAAATCAAFCALGERVACPAPADDCRPRCEVGLAAPCAPISRALIACVLGRAPADFTCDSRGKWRLPGDLCASEQTAVIRCLSDPGL